MKIIQVKVTQVWLIEENVQKAIFYWKAKATNICTKNQVQKKIKANKIKVVLDATLSRKKMLVL